MRVCACDYVCPLPAHAAHVCHVSPVPLSPCCLLLCEVPVQSYAGWHMGMAIAGDLSVGVGGECTHLDRGINLCLLYSRCFINGQSTCVHDECLVGHTAGCELQLCVQCMCGVLWGTPSMLNSSLSPGELLRWLEGKHLLHGLVANGDPMLILASPPLPQASHHHHHRRQAAATNPARHCCLSGCTRQDLLALCPH